MQIDTDTDTPTTGNKKLHQWKLWRSMDTPLGGDFRLWLQWAVARFPGFYEAPQPLDLAESDVSVAALSATGKPRLMARPLDVWRKEFKLWARVQSPTMREIAYFLLRFAGDKAKSEPSEYTLQLALVNMDDGNRRGMASVCMHPRIY